MWSQASFSRSDAGVGLLEYLALRPLLGAAFGCDMSQWAGVATCTTAHPHMPCDIWAMPCGHERMRNSRTDDGRSRRVTMGATNRRPPNAMVVTSMLTYIWCPEARGVSAHGCHCTRVSCGPIRESVQYQTAKKPFLT